MESGSLSQRLRFHSKYRLTAVSMQNTVYSCIIYLLIIVIAINLLLPNPVFVLLSKHHPFTSTSQKRRVSALNYNPKNLKQESSQKPWLVWLSGWSASLQIKGWLVQFPVREHAWVMGQVPSWGHVRGNQRISHTSVFLSLSFSFPSPYSIHIDYSLNGLE